MQPPAMKRGGKLTCICEQMAMRKRGVSENSERLLLRKILLLQ